MNPTLMIPPELHWLWSATWQAAVLAALVLLIQCLGRNLLSPSSRFVLWWLVLIRLCLPVTPESAWSVFNLAPQRAIPIASAPIVSDRAMPDPEDLTPRYQPVRLDWTMLAASDGTEFTVARVRPPESLPESDPHTPRGPGSEPFHVRQPIAAIWYTYASHSALPKVQDQMLVPRQWRFKPVANQWHGFIGTTTSGFGAISGQRWFHGHAFHRRLDASGGTARSDS